LVFAVSGNREAVFLSAYAEPAWKDDGRLFYFAKEGGGLALAAAAGEGARAAERAVRLSPEHEAGRYRVYAFVAERVLGADDMRGQRGGGAALAKVRVELVIVE